MINDAVVATPCDERALGATFYFETPHHAWERGTKDRTPGPGNASPTTRPRSVRCPSITVAVQR